MPIYEYECRQCSEHFEVLLYGDERAACPKCASEQLEKLIPSSFAVGGHSAPPGCSMPAPGGG